NPLRSSGSGSFSPAGFFSSSSPVSQAGRAGSFLAAAGFGASGDIPKISKQVATWKGSGSNAGNAGRAPNGLDEGGVFGAVAGFWPKGLVGAGVAGCAGFPNGLGGGGAGLENGRV